MFRVRCSTERDRPAWRAAFGAAAVVALLAGCRETDRGEAGKPPRVEEFTWGPVQVQLTVDPPVVDLARGVQLTVAVTAPPEIDVALPAINERVQGFTVSGRFEEEPVTKNGKKTAVTQIQLTPVVAERYRIAPMAIEYVDRAVQPPQKGWFPTRPIVLEKAALTRDDPGKDIRARLDPVRIYPPFRTVLYWLAAAAGVAAAGWGAWKLLSRVRENIQLARMSPRERALKELEKLLARDLIGKNKVKEFYLELTMIVRRYIERRHGVRAPEQTTEEFLSAAAADARFSPEVVKKLRSFLQAADLVKFAAYRPEEGDISRATGTAKDYIEHDTAEAAASGDKAEGGA